MPPIKDNSSNPNSEIENTILASMGIADDDVGDQDDDTNEDTRTSADKNADDEIEAKAQLPAKEEDPAFKDLNLETGDREPKKKTVTEDKAKPVPKGTGYAQDQKGNIVDRASGKVVAPAGVAARLFRDREQERTAHSNTKLQLNEVGNNLRRAIEIGRDFSTRIKAYKEANVAYSSLGLQPSEVIEAATLMAQLKKGGNDGVTALKEILTRAATNGIDTSSLGVAGGGLDPKAIVDAIRAEIKPLTTEISDRSTQDRERQADEAKQREAWTNAARTTYDFFEKNPEAQQYADKIEQLVKDPRMAGYSLREIWQEIRIWQMQNGAKPNGNRKPMPNGREMPSAKRGPPAHQGTAWLNKPAPAGTSQREIINELLDHFQDELTT